MLDGDFEEYLDTPYEDREELEQDIREFFEEELEGGTIAALGLKAVNDQLDVFLENEDISETSSDELKDILAAPILGIRNEYTRQQSGTTSEYSSTSRGGANR